MRQQPCIERHNNQQSSHTISLAHSVPHFPQEDSKLRATSIQVRRGGNVGNTLEVFAQLLATAGTNDLKVHLVACLPESCSPATAKILSSFGTNNVGEKMNTSRQLVIDFGYCLYRSGHQEPASSYIIRSTETGSRTIVNSNPLPEMTADEFKKIVDEFPGDGDGCWWHFEVCPLFTCALNQGPWTLSSLLALDERRDNMAGDVSHP
jgi:ketohexokinase